MSKKAEDTADPVPTLFDNLSELCLSERFADVYFRVSPSSSSEGERIPAHRLIVAAASPVFEAMLFPQTIASASSKINTNVLHEEYDIVINDTSPTMFKRMLKAIYHDSVNISVDHVIPLITLADKYQVDSLREHCIRCLEENANPRNVCTILEGSQKVMGDCTTALKFFTENFYEVIEAKEYLYLSTDTFSTILKSNSICAAEVDIFCTANTWAAAECKRQKMSPTGVNKRRVLGDALKYIRFPVMSVTEIAKKVQTTGILTEDELFDIYTWIGAEENKKPKIPFLCTMRSGSSMLIGSSILNSAQQMLVHDMLPTTRQFDTWNLCYRMSRDGGTATQFHAHVESKTPSIVIIKTTNNHFIFGGYTEAAWTGSAYKTDANAFIFSLVNSLHRPVKLRCVRPAESIYAYPTYGPVFGSGFNIYCSTQFDTMSNYVNPSAVYTPADSSVIADTYFLAGQQYFQIAEMEVYIPKPRTATTSSAQTSALDTMNITTAPAPLNMTDLDVIDY
eukprot:TRINITY_DN145_c0_g3_i1.p1 TRINITY_DN145_c0_g3~~TRINITY_DN145_c0_g3_i1.p1  ORF type:complete len:561 (-),score=76.33 TRINITY_DN145_c0_g3_i1:66-1589(-)